MPSATPRSALAIRPQPSSSTPHEPQPRNLKHRPCTSFPDASEFLSSLNFSPLPRPVQQPHYANTHENYCYTQSENYELDHRPSKRPMPTPKKTIAVVNSSGRQAASFIRVASAVGYHVRAQLRNLDGIVASEISSLPNVTVIVGDLYTKRKGAGSSASPSLRPSDTGVNHELIKELFLGAQLAFINTTFWGDEIALGKALADAAVEANIEHYIYSSMPNHSLHSDDADPPAAKPWPSLPLWSSKATIEQYIRSLPKLADKSTFLYTGIYNNNFTSLPYPLFCMELQSDGSFLWVAPFHPDVKLPWLDAEHDVGPAVLQIFKEGVRKWGKGERIALAYEMLSPREACREFEKGVGSQVRYRRDPRIEVRVKIPTGYRDQLVALEEMYAISAKDPNLQPPYFGDRDLEDSCPREALELWEGYRGLEEYAREVFPLEEAANGLTWMNEGNETDGEVQGGEEEQEEDDDDDDEGLTIGGGTTSGEATPARKEETWLA